MSRAPKPLVLSARAQGNAVAIVARWREFGVDSAAKTFRVKPHEVRHLVYLAQQRGAAGGVFTKAD